MAPLLFLSPCLCELNFGGVQLSGKIARDRLARGNPDFRLLCYGKMPGIHHAAECAQSRLAAMLRAARLRGAAGDALFWHLAMLKLLPILGRRRGRIYLFLHGVECWRTLEPKTQRLLRRVDLFLTNSSFTWARFLENNPQWASAAHRVVPLGLDAPQEAVAPPGSTPAALILGRMQKGENYKGHEELIRAWPLVRRRLPAAELWIAGGGDLGPELKKAAAQSGDGAHVRFFGVVTEEEKRRLIAEARCVALPSRGEGFGLVYLEAMRAGRPCLCSTMDAGREVVNPPEAGLAVDPEDPVAMSDAIVRLLTPGPEWQCRSARAKARYDSRFTAQHFEDRLLLALS